MMNAWAQQQRLGNNYAQQNEMIVDG